MDCGNEILDNGLVVRAWLMDCGKESLVNGQWYEESG